MPCILKIRVIGARDLPVMDKASDLTDAYVEVRFADFEAQRTTVCRKTLNPVWNEDFRFEVTDDADLQNEPLELKVLDYDAITANDSVGSVFIDLNPLLPVNSPWQIAGWFPIYDTIRGVRGEVNVQVKLQFFGDVNPFKDSSAGIMFFSTTSLPAGYQIVAMHGFVDAIVNEDDPEYHWSDSFRTQRSSNEARQRLLFRLSGQLRRLLGKETLDMGGNAVLGYQQCFDLESEEHAITARAVGTAVKIAVVTSSTPQLSEKIQAVALNDLHTEDILSSTLDSAQRTSPINANTEGVPPSLAQRRRESSISTETSGSTNSAPSVASGAKNSINNYKYLEQQIFTLHEFPPGTVFNLGGIVSARSVKLIENDDVETRDAWWNELRDEIKSHARVLGCSHVIGYQEAATINDELIVLSAVGTAANLDMTAFTPGFFDANKNLSRSGSISRSYVDNPADSFSSSIGGAKASLQNSLKEQQWMELLAKRKSKRKQPSACRMCHIPFHRKSSPFPMSLVKCQKCKKKYVPEILLSTVEPPAELGVVGQSAFVEAHVCRAKKRKDGESNATIVSDAIPFVEYDLHRQLMYKLKIHGLNAIFGLRFQLTIGDSLIVAVASGTAMYLSALPTPPALRISRNLDVIDEEDKKLLEIQRKIMDLSEKNRQNLEAEKLKEQDDGEPSTILPLSDGVQAAQPDDDSSGSSSDSDDEVEKENYQTNVVIQIDDDADEDLMAVLLDPVFTDGFLLCSTETLPNHPYFVSTDPMIPDNAHLITTVKQGHINMISHHPNRQLAALFRSIYEDLRFRLSYFTDCVLAGISYHIQLPRANEVQIQLTGVALGQQRQADALEPLGVPITLSPWRSIPSSAILTASHSRADSENGLYLTGASPITARPTAVDESMVFQMDEYPLSEPSRSALSTQAAMGPIDISKDLETSRVSSHQVMTQTPGDKITESTSTIVPDTAIHDHNCRIRAIGNESSSQEDGSGIRVGDYSLQDNLSQIPSAVSSNLAPPQNLAKHSNSSNGSQHSENNFGVGATRPRYQFGRNGRQQSISSTLGPQEQVEELGRLTLLPMMPADRPFIEMTPLSFIPGRTPTRYLGKLSLHFVKETHILHDATVSSGMGGFVHVFLMEIQAVARSHVAALGGDAILGLRVDESFFQESVKNQGYALISISGDVVGCALLDEESVSSHSSDSEDENRQGGDAINGGGGDSDSSTEGHTAKLGGWQSSKGINGMDIPSSTLQSDE
ncbi:hypothetical protein BX616_006910 [Lobosporangium transversale]|uniref:C2 domain-containing protein n=1 Tax=Lobosporangium transversale TaxID=64571 RepID=A0A1Y2GCN9_9FUNG|nr:hypothetical protein BCR41DRAFT_326754 [Lobosporangium transversale]KAF9918664.1 hypothetical protein BX616_006910 [Lobosporangium transversale]ORZ07053.1 hypothetical protein BCR41DRAFT_326754 [Lobosporangium transversale]|eukprot:XP_021877849.1 hypothetical protein BCR41DRAFT_326754 [Lobosporangium transversale]